MFIQRGIRFLRRRRCSYVGRGTAWEAYRRFARCQCLPRHGRWWQVSCCWEGHRFVCFSGGVGRCGFVSCVAVLCHFASCCPPALSCVKLEARFPSPAAPACLFACLPACLSFCLPCFCLRRKGVPPSPILVLNTQAETGVAGRERIGGINSNDREKTPVQNFFSFVLFPKMQTCPCPFYA